MPIPTLITDLSTTISSNSPAGSDTVFPDLDNYVRALSGFLASIRSNSGNGWVSPYATAASPTITGTATVDIVNASGAVTFGSTALANGASSVIGYATGAGGSVTQTGSKTDTVILNKPCGRVIMHNAALASGASATFNVTNSFVDTSDLVIVSANYDSGTTGAYLAQLFAVFSGGFAVRVTNSTGGSLSETPHIVFTVIKGVTS